MTVGFDAHAVDNRLMDRGIVLGMGAQQGKQGDNIVLTKAGVKITLCSDANSVATIAKVVACLLYTSRCV